MGKAHYFRPPPILKAGGPRLFDLKGVLNYRLKFEWTPITLSIQGEGPCIDKVIGVHSNLYMGGSYK
jgi:hypothetical protein